MAEPGASALIGLTASLVAAYVRGNSTPVSELADLIRITHSAMAAVLSATTEPAHPQQPAVPIKRSVKPHSIVCLECGQEKQMLKRHLRINHGLAVEDYRAKWSLPADYPTTAPDYASTRSDLAKKFGLGRKSHAARTANAPEPIEPEKAAPGQKYPASRWSKPAQ